MGTRSGIKGRWKGAEDELAALFGTRRRPLSGLNHGTDRGDDAQHEKLYLECKYGKQCDKLLALFADTARKAANERHPNRTKVGRVPVVGIKAAGQKGMLLIVHSSDLFALFTEWALANGVARDEPALIIPAVQPDIEERVAANLRKYGKRLKSGLKANPLPKPKRK